MLHLFLLYTLPVLFRFLPKCLEISLALVWKKLGLIKLTSVSSELLKILLENVLAYQVVKFISSLCCLIILLFKHVMERIKWLTKFKVLIKVLKKSMYACFLLLQPDRLKKLKALYIKENLFAYKCNISSLIKGFHKGTEKNAYMYVCIYVCICEPIGKNISGKHQKHITMVVLYDYPWHILMNN